MEKKNKAVLITGATKRLGLAFTKQSLAMGFSVIAHYHTTAGPLKTWLRKNSRYKNNIYFIRLNLTENPETLIDKTLDFPVTLTGLINNASTFTEGNLNNISHFKETVIINTTVPLLLSHRFNEKIGNGWIINIADANTTSMNRTYQNYRISKIFLTELTRQEAYLFAPNIRVNAIALGAIMPSRKKDSAYFDKVKDNVPLRKKVDITSVMKAYTFLIENTSVTGQTLYIDNGLHLCR